MLKIKLFGIRLVWFLLILVIVVVFVLIVFRSSRRLKNSKPGDENSKAKAMREAKRLIDSVDNDLDEGTRRMILAQAMWESDDFTSWTFKQNNNMFGMREAKVRDQLGPGDTNDDNYANYNSLKQGVEDHKKYLEYVGIYTNYSSIPKFVRALKEHDYFEASEISYRKGIELKFLEVNQLFGAPKMGGAGGSW